MTITILPLVLVCACADERTGAPEPVRRDEVASTVVTTTTAAPPSTKPLVTAPPSPLLDEVVAAYDAAYADLLAASESADEHHPLLDRYIAGSQLAKWRSVVRDLRRSDRHVRIVDGRWRRIEDLRVMGDGDVEVTVCRFDPDQVIDRSGDVVGEDHRPFRFVETLWLVNGGWKWVGREWVDSAESSDCALPSPSSS